MSSGEDFFSGFYYPDEIGEDEGDTKSSRHA